jgi:hypothetical protein
MTPDWATVAAVARVLRWADVRLLDEWRDDQWAVASGEPMPWLAIIDPCVTVIVYRRGATKYSETVSGHPTEIAAEVARTLSAAHAAS